MTRKKTSRPPTPKGEPVENLEVAPPPLDPLPQLEEAAIDLAAVKTLRWNAILTLQGEEKPKDLILYGSEEDAIALLKKNYNHWVNLELKPAGHITVGGRMVTPPEEKFELIDNQHERKPKKSS